MMLHIDCCSDGCRAVYMALSHGYSQSPSRNDLFNMENCSRSQQFWEMQSLPGPHMSLSMVDLWIYSSQIELDLSHGNTYGHASKQGFVGNIYVQTEAMSSGCLQLCFIHCFVVVWLHVRSCLCLCIILYPMCCRFYLAFTVSRSFEGTVLVITSLSWLVCFWPMMCSRIQISCAWPCWQWNDVFSRIIWTCQLKMGLSINDACSK